MEKELLDKTTDQAAGPTAIGAALRFNDEVNEIKMRRRFAAGDTNEMEPAPHTFNRDDFINLYGASHIIAQVPPEDVSPNTPIEPLKQTEQLASDDSDRYLTPTDNKNWQPTLEPDSNDFNPWDNYAVKRMVDWAARQAKDLGFDPTNKNDEPYFNALRHMMTAAIYKLKYGDIVAKALADANERKHPWEWLTKSYERADSYADRCNNYVGFQIADELEARRQKGEKIGIHDVVESATEALKAGRCVTNKVEVYQKYLDKLQTENSKDSPWWQSLK